MSSNSLLNRIYPSAIDSDSIEPLSALHKKLKKTPSKVAQKNSNPLFSLTASTAQMAQTEEFMFQNVAHRPTVYRTGSHLLGLLIEFVNYLWLLQP